MKKLIALVSVVFAFTNMSAQLKVHSNGNVSKLLRHLWQ